MRQGLFVALAGLVVLLAGCTGASSSAAPQTSEAPSVVDPGSGGAELVGLVTDDSLMPVQGATAGLEGVD